MNRSGTDDITRMLLGLSEALTDDDELLGQVYQILYDELRRIAGRLMRGERSGHTLQPTALVNEAYIKLVDGNRVDWRNRAHFFGIAARAMRQILIDHARRHLSQKRGGGWNKVTLDDQLAAATGADLEIMALHEALERLAVEDERMSRVVELRIFAGMTGCEIAHVLDVSPRTVEGDWKVAKMWLGRELTGDAGE